MKTAIIIGLDLAAKEKNPSGFCFLKESILEVTSLKSNSEIIENIFRYKPDIVAIDAPLTLELERNCDKLMKKYGAMPLKMQSIMELALRAISIVDQIRNVIDVEIIEVFPTGTSKVLGFYNKDFLIKLDNFKEKLNINVTKKVSRDEFDAVISALTGYLYLLGLTEKVGDNNGWIIIPNSLMKEKILTEIQTKRFQLV